MSCACALNDPKGIEAYVSSLVSQHGTARSALIPILQAIQSLYNYLPKELLLEVSKQTAIPLSNIYGVATFYENFSLLEKGKYVVKVCNGTACHVRKSDDVQAALYEATGMTPEDHISKDGLFTIERVSCLGACGLAPVCMINDVVHGAMTPDKMKALIAEIKEAEGV